MTQRELLMRPDAIVNELLTYFLGYYAGLHCIAIHSFIFLSNHYHLVVSNPLANLPAFMRDFDAISARAMNAHRGRFENVWAPGSYGEARLERTSADILTALRYVTCNAVEAALVSAAKQWPGLKVLPHEIGKRTFRACRPDWFCN
ncbi:MAG: hypothetical protein L0Z55_07465, partial [Planctomycetes bacterium]|nr:hypothetical protein [Planctomycetota bacterium]